MDVNIRKSTAFPYPFGERQLSKKRMRVPVSNKGGHALVTTTLHYEGKQGLSVPSQKGRKFTD